MIGIGLLRDATGDYIIIDRSAEDNPRPLAETSFYLAKRYFVERPEDGLLAGEEIIMPPHWVSFFGSHAFRVDWFPEAKEFEIYNVHSA